MRHRWSISHVMRQAGLALFLALGACAVPQTVQSPPQPDRIVADTSDFMIVRSADGDSFASLAAQYLGDRKLAAVLQDVNGRRLDPGQLLVLPKRPINPFGVKANGYQVVPILCYHQFSRGQPHNRMQVTGDAFEAQMRYLKDNRFRVITLKELEGFLTGVRPIPERAVVVTIDDGYRSVYDIAYPILRRLGLNATLFVYTDFIGGGLSLTWDQMRRMRSSGVIDIQPHSKTHTSLSLNGNEKPGPAYIKRIEYEVEEPDRILTEKLGAPVRYFAYPYGDTSEEMVRLLQRKSYAIAMTVQRGGNTGFAHPLLLHRDMVYSNHALRDLRKFLKVFTSVDLK